MRAVAVSKVSGNSQALIDEVRRVLPLAATPGGAG
jgi:hypothetical protein